jgi:hypothetical protein
LTVIDLPVELLIDRKIRPPAHNHDAFGWL